MLSRLMLTAVVSFAAVTGAGAATYEVGPGKPYATPSAVPWESLQAGDLVLIHWRSAPYKDKWVICRQGTASAPIVVRGVAGPAGERPVIDGNGAVTRLQLDYWGEQRAVIKIGGSSIPADVMPRYIVIEGLEIRSARPPYTYTDDSGNAGSIALHRRFGFEPVGTLRSAGFKLGRWVDTVLMQRSLGPGDSAPPESWMAGSAR